MTKTRKIGLGVFLGIVGVLLIILVLVFVIMYGGPTYDQPGFAQNDMQGLQQKLPAFADLEALIAQGKQAGSFAQPKTDTVTLSEKEFNAMLALSADQSHFAQSLLGSKELPIAEMRGYLKDEVLQMQLKLGDCTGVTGSSAVDNYLSGTVLTAEFTPAGDRLLLTKAKFRSIDINQLTGLLSDFMPNYTGGTITDYVNTQLSDSVNATFSRLFLAQRLDSYQIAEGQITVSGAFYQVVME